MRYAAHLFQLGAMLVFLNLARAEIRLGVLPVAEATQPAADLLTAAFTGAANVVLVERADVDRVLGEQALVSANNTDFARLGQLLRADGLVLLQLLTTSHTTNLAVRLVAVNSGVVLDAALYLWPLKEAVEWSGLVSRRFGPLMPKLGVARDQAVPISFLNLRAAVSTPDSAQTERSLSALLYHRLMEERELFVLERREMGRLQWEKDLPGPDAGQFWSGSYLLDGVIDRDGASPDTVTIQARLVGPDQGVPVNLEVAGPRQKLAAVAEQLAERIMAAIRRERTVFAWNPDDEAARFEEEAVWALRWGMWPEAAAAAESAVALGRRTEKAVGLKVKALLEQSVTGETFVFDSVRKIGWAENEPTPESLPNAQAAIDAYLAHCLATETNRWMTNGSWIGLGIETLQASALVLRHHYFYGWRRDRFDAGLAQLRQSARSLVETLPSDAHRSNSRRMVLVPGQRPTRFHPAPNFPITIGVYTLPEALGRYGALWQETPQDAISMYRRLMATGDYDRERESILLRPWQQPLWVGWTKSDLSQGRQMWQSFVAELLASTNELSRAEGALLVLHESQSAQEITNASAGFLQVVFNTNQMRFTTNVGFAVLDDFDNLLTRKCREIILPTLRWVDGNAPAPTINPWLLHWRVLDFQRLIHYLQTAQKHDVDRAGWPIAKATFTASQAAELHPVMADYARRFPKGDYIATSLNKLRDQVAKTKSETNSVSPTVAPPSLTTSVPPIVSIATNALRVTRAWIPQITEEQAKFDARRLFLQLREREGRLYALVPYSRQTTFRSGGSIAILPESFCSVVELDLKRGGYRTLIQELPHKPSNPLRYDIAGDGLYWMEDEPAAIHRFDLKSGRRDRYSLSLPVTFNTSLVAIGPRLFVVSPEYIAEFESPKGTLKLLASSRRRPAASALDEWNWYGVPRLALSGDGSLCATFTIRTTIVSWRLDQPTGTWSQLPEFPGKGTVDYGAGHYLFYNPRFDGCFDQALAPGGAPEVLLGDESLLPRWPIPFNYPLTPGSSLGSQAQHVYDGTNLLIFMPPQELVRDVRSARLVSLADRHKTLLWFYPAGELPAEIPLWFQAEAPFSPGSVELGGRGVLVSISHGLLVLGKNTLSQEDMSSIWFIPWRDIFDWRARYHPEARNLPRREPEIRRRFDLNGDGHLDESEQTAMQADAGWRQDSLHRHARRLLLTFDADHNGLLDEGELARLNPATLRPASRLMPGMMPQSTSVFGHRNILSTYDQDRSGSLDLGELSALLRGEGFSGPVPRPVRPGVGSSGSFGPTTHPIPPFGRTNSPPAPSR